MPREPQADHFNWNSVNHVTNSTVHRHTPTAAFRRSATGRADAFEGEACISELEQKVIMITPKGYENIRRMNERVVFKHRQTISKQYPALLFMTPLHGMCS